MAKRLFLLTALSFLLVSILVNRLSSNFYRDLAQSGKKVLVERKETRKILVSTDNSTTLKSFGLFPIEQDDGLALALLLKAHRDGRLQILGITSTFGNADGERTYEVTKQQVELSQVQVPVVKGALRAGQEDSPATEFIAQTLREAEGKVTLIALGPVTDYAAVFRKNPDLVEKVDLFFFIRSGPYYLPPYWYLFSFNALKDIAAARFLNKLPAPKAMIGKEITQVFLTNEDILKIKQNLHPMIQFVTRELVGWNLVNNFLPHPGYLQRRGNMCPWDLVWSLYLVQPDLFETYHQEGLLFFIRIKNLSELKTAAIETLKDF